uniref:non-specific serine/threonine protein kinase n=2 Tax=Manihot esculenta TaxID=3983 RepID=A0A2C9UYC4_MANES
MASRQERTSSTIGPKQYSFEELVVATGGFSRKNLLGEGGYGEVFKGFLDEYRAIKKLRIISSDEQRKKELEHEIKVINSVSHRNLVKLVGYCIEENDVLLVLEYFPNKCLKYNLHERKERILVWQERMQIAKGLAKGLEYLHEYCNFKIIHQDIKPGNILLDNNFEPKIADFGLALFLPDNATHVSQSAVGTEVYMEKSKRISKKSDVYSFGIVLLELITGRKPICDGIDIVNWAKNPIKQALMGQYSGFVDSKLQSYNVEEIKLMICCAEHCVYKPSTDRPRIREIVRVLEGFIPPQDKDANDFLQHRVQKLSIIPETDDNDSVESEVYSTRMFSYQQLERATQGFSQFLGEGSLGQVYKGYLDGKEVAVRQLKQLPDEKQRENLEKDIKIIGSVNHPNLVRQLGYSTQGLNRFLALEFFPSISLKSLLHGKRTLEWSERVKIAIDSAKGLEYLHENCKIIHGDIMTNNILIDNNFQSKVTNFGLIKYYRSERTVVYADPEDRKGTSEKSDIYAFGVVLLELITGIDSRKKGANNIINGV